MELALGDLIVEDLDFVDSEFEMALGDVDFTGTLHGRCKFDVALGDVRMMLNGSRSDYRIEAENAMGSLGIDGAYYDQKMANSWKDTSRNTLFESGECHGGYGYPVPLTFK